MAVEPARVTIGTAAVLLSGGSDRDDVSGHSVLVRPSAAIRVGGPAVTAADGYELPGGAEYAFDLGPRDFLFGVVATGTVAVDVLRMGV